MLDTVTCENNLSHCLVDTMHGYLHLVESVFVIQYLNIKKSFQYPHNFNLMQIVSKLDKGLLSKFLYRINVRLKDKCNGKIKTKGRRKHLF